MIAIDIIISNTGNQPIYEQIYEQLKGLIISGKLSSGEPLPSIRGLAKDLRISVITTKRAYDELEHEGFIHTVAGKGCFVAEKNLELIREENLKQIENYFQQIIDLSTTCNLGKSELLEMLQLLLEEESKT